MRPDQEGYTDFYKGQITNPYNLDTSRHRDWEFGFNRAYFENLEKVQQIEQEGRKFYLPKPKPHTGKKRAKARANG